MSWRCENLLLDGIVGVLARLMNYPPSLVPSSSQSFKLSPTNTLQVPKARPEFVAWAGVSPADTYNGKQLLDFKGRCAFAELVVLWSMNECGWDGVWIDTYSRLYRTGYWDSPPVVELPSGPAAVLDRVRLQSKSRHGAWDVFCWRGQEILIAECKRDGKDKIRESQFRWLKAALEVGLPADQFLVVEWSLSSCLTK